MTNATLEALMNVYGILLREGWDEPDDADADRPRDRTLSEAEVEVRDAIEEHKRASGKSVLTWDEVLEVLGRLGYQWPDATHRASDGGMPSASAAPGEGRGHRRVS